MEIEEMAREPDDIVQFKVRLREDLRSFLEQQAKRHDQSLNTEIVSRLDATMREHADLGGGVQGDVLLTMRKVMDRVTEELGAPWCDDHDGWAIVRGVILYTLDKMEPAPVALPDLPKDPDTVAALDAYEAEYAAWRERQHEFGRRHAELFLKGERGGLSDAEEAEKAAIDQASIADRHQPVPQFSGDLLQLWQAHDQRRRRVKRAESGAIAVAAHRWEKNL